MGCHHGNFLIGDMNEFGTVYMSTVGCGIVYMQSAGGTDPKPTTTTTTTTTTETIETTTTLKTTTETGETTTTSSGVVTTTTVTTTNNDDVVGDINADGKVDLTDAICINKYLAGQMELSEQAKKCANCDQSDGTATINEADGTALINFVIMIIVKLPV